MNQFISGNIAMMVNGPWQVPTMREQAPDLNWDVTLLPKDAEYASCLGGENFGVIDGDNVDAEMCIRDSLYVLYYLYLKSVRVRYEHCYRYFLVFYDLFRCVFAQH